MAAQTEAVVIQFSAIYRQRLVTPVPHSEGAHLIDFKSCVKRIQGLRAWREYADMYLRNFHELEEECLRMMNGFVTYGICGPGYFARDAANNFLATGAIVQKAAKKLGGVPAVSKEAQALARRLRKAIQEIPMLRKGAKKDLYAELSQIIGLCRRLRGTLYPLRKEIKTSTPAHA